MTRRAALTLSPGLELFRVYNLGGIMASLSDFNVVEKANDGSVLEIIAYADFYDQKSGELKISKGDVLTDEGEKCSDKKDIKNWYVKLLGVDSDQFRKLSNRRLERAQGKKSKKIDIDSMRRETAEIFAKCTTECYIIDGSPIECTYSEMVRVYLKYPWLYEQVDAFMAERSNFT